MSGFLARSARASNEKPGNQARAAIGSRKGDLSMILMLVIRLAFVGRVSALIVWTRESQR